VVEANGLQFLDDIMQFILVVENGDELAHRRAKIGFHIHPAPCDKLSPWDTMCDTMYDRRERQVAVTTLEIMKQRCNALRHHSIAISGQSVTICYVSLSRSTASTSRKNTPGNRPSMSLLSFTKITAAIVGSVALVAVLRWIAADVFYAASPVEPAYKVPGVTESRVDLATAQRRWPQALESEEARGRLLSYMRNMPKEVASNVAPGATPAAAPPEPPLDLPTRLARADVAKGERSVSKCAVCHTIEKGGPVRVGPNLWGVVGRPVAKAAGFSYSDAMKEKGEKTGTWVPNELDIFLTKPENVVPGTRMTFPGLPDQQERADVITYLNTQSDNPLPLPKAPG
jgi:cytochrome c